MPAALTFFKRFRCPMFVISKFLLIIGQRGKMRRTWSTPRHPDQKRTDVTDDTVAMGRVPGGVSNSGLRRSATRSCSASGGQTTSTGGSRWRTRR